MERERFETCVLALIAFFRQYEVILGGDDRGAWLLDCEGEKYRLEGLLQGFVYELIENTRVDDPLYEATDEEEKEAYPFSPPYVKARTRELMERAR